MRSAVWQLVRDFKPCLSGADGKIISVAVLHSGRDRGNGDGHAAGAGGRRFAHLRAIRQRHGKSLIADAAARRLRLIVQDVRHLVHPCCRRLPGDEKRAHRWPGLQLRGGVIHGHVDCRGSGRGSLEIMHALARHAYKMGCIFVGNIQRVMTLCVCFRVSYFFHAIGEREEGDFIA